MKLKLAKAAAAVTIAAAAIFAPVAANAVSYTPPTTSVSGNTVNVTFAPGSFAGAENVTIFLTGFNAAGGSVATGVVKAAANTTPVRIGEVDAANNGAANARVILPSNARGTYTITGTSASNPAGVSATITLAATDGSTGGGLPATGMDSGSLLGLWVGGGALVLAGGAVAVGAAVHRQRKMAA